MIVVYITKNNYDRLKSKLNDQFAAPRFHLYKDCKWLNQSRNSDIIIIQISISTVEHIYTITEVNEKDLAYNYIENQNLEAEMMKINKGFKINNKQIHICPECSKIKFPKWFNGFIEEQKVEHERLRNELAKDYINKKYGTQ